MLVAQWWVEVPQIGTFEIVVSCGLASCGKLSEIVVDFGATRINVHPNAKMIWYVNSSNYYNGYTVNGQCFNFSTDACNVYEPVQAFEPVQKNWETFEPVHNHEPVQRLFKVYEPVHIFEPVQKVVSGLWTGSYFWTGSKTWVYIITFLNRFINLQNMWTGWSIF